MSRPTKRAGLPQRDDRLRKRWLLTICLPQSIAVKFAGIRYGCFGKHKANPTIYGVEPYHGTDSDRTLCDKHAGFGKADIARIPALLKRAEDAGLIGNLIWSVDNNGWIYELQVTNIGQNEWHGYPMLPSDPFARTVWLRFREWAAQHGSQDDQDAAHSCGLRYGLKT